MYYLVLSRQQYEDIINEYLCFGNVKIIIQKEIPETMTPYEFKLNFANDLLGTCDQIIIDDFVPQAAQCKPEKKAACVQKEAQMSCMDIRQQDFLLCELDRVYTNKDAELRKQFHLEDDPDPRSWTEFLKRIKDGKFVFPDAHKDRRMGTYNIIDYIEWRDPSMKKDEDGYRVANEKLSELYRTTKQDIMIEPAEKGLKALRKLESATIQ